MDKNKIKIHTNILLLSLCCIGLIIVGDSFIDAHYFHQDNFLEQLLNPSIFELYVRAVNIIIVLAFGAIASRIVYKLRCSEEEKSNMISALQKANDEIKLLKGILPICSCCKKIRDDNGIWNHFEHYIAERTEAEFSHGFCPECGVEYYPKHFQDRRG